MKFIQTLFVIQYNQYRNSQFGSDRGSQERMYMDRKFNKIEQDNNKPSDKLFMLEKVSRLLGVSDIFGAFLEKTEEVERLFEQTEYEQRRNFL